MRAIVACYRVSVVTVGKQWLDVLSHVELLPARTVLSMFIKADEPNSRGPSWEHTAPLALHRLAKGHARAGERINRR
ncbi:MAG: hypothetical protein ABR615_01570 [Pseudonocardiaceae bacterium]